MPATFCDPANRTRNHVMEVNWNRHADDGREYDQKMLVISNVQ
jgi:hypothetical protein